MKHIRNIQLTPEQDAQLDRANTGFFDFIKLILCLIVVVWLCRDVTQPAQEVKLWRVDYHAPHETNVLKSLGIID